MDFIGWRWPGWTDLSILRRYYFAFLRLLFRNRRCGRCYLRCPTLRVWHCPRLRRLIRWLQRLLVYSVPKLLWLRPPACVGRCLRVRGNWFRFRSSIFWLLQRKQYHFQWHCIGGWVLSGDFLDCSCGRCRDGISGLLGSWWEQER